MSRDFYLKQINYKLDKVPLFFITNDPERALGLEKLLQNYYIVCLDDSDIFTNLHLKVSNIFSLENSTKDLNAIFRSSAKLLDAEPVRQFIKSKDGKFLYFQTFKISSAFEERAKEYGAMLVNTNSILNQEFENKIPQYENLEPAGIRFPKTLITKLNGANYRYLKKTLDNKLVVQFNRGHTGSGTKIITGEGDYKELQALFPERVARISEFIEGYPYTLNAVASKNGVFIGGLSYQVTGVKGIAPSKAATVGNDFSYRKGITKKIKDQILEQVKKIGDAMIKKGFLGMFGVDLIVRGNEIFIIEVNARQPASIPLYTKLQLMQGQIPLSMLHIMEFLKIANHEDAKSYSRENIEPTAGGQVFLRNNSKKPFAIKGRVKTGVYKMKGERGADTDGVSIIKLGESIEKTVCFQKDGYSIEDIDGGFLLLSQLKGKRINPGGELARIQAIQGLVGEDGLPHPWVIESLLAVKEYLL